MVGRSLPPHASLRCSYTPRKWAIHEPTKYMITIETDNNALTLKEEEKALEELMQEGDSAPPQVRARTPETS